MWGHRRRRWAIIKPTLFQCVVFAGKAWSPRVVGDPVGEYFSRPGDAKSVFPVRIIDKATSKRLQNFRDFKV